jgi:hypothetical protein
VASQPFFFLLHFKVQCTLRCQPGGNIPFPAVPAADTLAFVFGNGGCLPAADDDREANSPGDWLGTTDGGVSVREWRHVLAWRALGSVQ